MDLYFFLVSDIVALPFSSHKQADSCCSTNHKQDSPSPTTASRYTLDLRGIILHVV